MYKFNTLLVLLALLFLLPPPILNAQLLTPAGEEPMVPDMLIVKFKSPTLPRPYRFANAERKATMVPKAGDALAKILQTPGVYCFDKALGGGSELAQRVYCLRFDPDQVSMATLEAALNKLPSVEYVEHDVMLEGHQGGAQRRFVPSAQAATPPNDPLIDQQYNLRVTRALEARALLRRRPAGTATVAVVDDAVYTEHEDLAANIFTNPGETGTDSTGAPRQSNGIDDDGNGYVDDWQGYDVADGDNDPTPPDNIPLRAGSTTEPAFYHGTHIAGVAAGVTDNGVGIASLTANRVKIIPVKATPDSVTTLSYTGLNIARGITYAVDIKADVINLSLGSFFIRNSRLYLDVLDMGAAAGVLFVSSAGNNPGPERSFPAAFDNVLAVAGTNVRDAAYLNTSYGDWIDVAAPAVSVLSTYVPLPGEVDRNPYEELTGTSFASPFVAGLAALLKSYDFTLTPAQLREIIKRTADPIDKLNVRLSGQLGAGRVNVYNALAEVVKSSTRPIADFTVLSPETYVMQGVCIVNRSLGKDLRYRWIFPGGTPTSTEVASPVVTYRRPGRYPIILIVRNDAGVDVEVKREFITVQPVPQVDVVGFPFSGPVKYDTLPPGRATRFANQLVYPKDRLLTSVRISIFQLPEGRFPPNFSVIIQRVRNGQTITTLYEQEVDVDSLTASGLADVPSYNDIILDQPFRITANDTFLVGILSTSLTPVKLHQTPAAGYGAFVNYRSVAELQGGEEGFRWLIFPTLVDPEYLPVPEIAAGGCRGETIVLDASKLDDAFAYSWLIKPLDANPFLSQPDRVLVNERDSVIFDNRFDDDYLVSLRAARSAEVCRLDTTFTTDVVASLSDTLRIVNCLWPTEPAFMASVTTLEEGQQVTYTVNENSNANLFEWSFPGGKPGSARGASVTVTYPDEGVYDVSLTASQQGERANTLRVSDYIVVTAPSCTDFTVEGLPLSGIDVISSTVDRVAGHGPDNLRAFGNLFTVAPDQQLYGMRALVARARADNEALSGITVFMWDNDGEDGTPGTVLAQQRFTYSQLEALAPPRLVDQYIAENPQVTSAFDLRFDDPVDIPSDSTFILGFEIEYGEENRQEFVVFYDFADFSSEVAGSTSFLRFANGSWSTYRQAGGGIFNIRLGLGAIVGDPDVIAPPVASFTVLDEGPYTGGGAIRLQIDEEDAGAVAYRWEVEVIEIDEFDDQQFADASTSLLSDNREIVALDETTIELQTEEESTDRSLIYHVTLVAINACGIEDRATQTIEITSEEFFEPEISLTLINAESGEVLFDFTDREESVTNLIYLEDPAFAEVPLSLRTTVTDGSVGSIGFVSRETFGIAHDNSSPYELVGDQPGQIEEWDLVGGDYFFSAVAFPAAGGFNGGGEQGPRTRVRLLVYDSLMIPLKIIPLCVDDPETRSWEIDNANNTDIAFEYQLSDSDEWLASAPAPPNFFTFSRIVTEPVDRGSVLRIRWRNEVGEFEFAEATAIDELCPVEGAAQVAASASSKTEESVELEGMRAYPNPTTGLLTVDGLPAMDEPVEVWVMDALGKLYLHQQVRAVEKFQLELGSLPAGVYRVLLRSGEVQSTQLVVKQ